MYNEKYKILLNKDFILGIHDAKRIQKKAHKRYEMVINNHKQILTDNSCDFKILEDGYRKYIKKYLK